MSTIPMVLVPGLLCDDALWAHQASALSQVATCTITDKHMCYANIGEVADAIVAQAPPRFALAGLSMGGYIALEICRKYGSRVDRLALLDTSARADTVEQTDRREKLIALCRKGKFADVIELLCAALVHPDRMNDTALISQITDMARRIGPEVFIRQQRAIMGRINQVPYLSKILCPTMVVCGEQDQVTPLKCSEEMASCIKGSKLETIINCGHMSTIEKPEEISNILCDWLSASYDSKKTL